MKIAQIGFGPWGTNLARNFNELASLGWICEVDDERRALATSRFPAARTTADVNELLDDPEVEGVIIATP
ncbi:MAG: gfo/Idh/MocA family oxidoreductase, partial [Gaiellales bacterium]